MSQRTPVRGDSKRTTPRVRAFSPSRSPPQTRKPPAEPARVAFRDERKVERRTPGAGTDQIKTLTIAPDLAWVSMPIEEKMVELHSSSILDFNISPAQDVRLYSVQPRGGKGDDTKGATDMVEMYTGQVMSRDRSGPARITYAVPYPEWKPSHALHTDVSEGDIPTWDTFVTFPARLPNFGPMDRVSLVHQERTLQPEEEEDHMEYKSVGRGAMAKMSAAPRAQASPVGKLEEIKVLIASDLIKPGTKVAISSEDVSTEYRTVFHIPQMYDLKKGLDAPDYLPTKAKMLVQFQGVSTTSLFPGPLTVFRPDQTPIVVAIGAQHVRELRLNLGVDPDVEVQPSETVTETKTTRTHKVVCLIKKMSTAEKILELVYTLFDSHFDHADPEPDRREGNTLRYVYSTSGTKDRAEFTVTYTIPPERVRLVLQKGRPELAQYELASEEEEPMA